MDGVLAPVPMQMKCPVPSCGLGIVIDVGLGASLAFIPVWQARRLVAGHKQSLSVSRVLRIASRSRSVRPCGSAK